ncbi:MAG TPA: hypothetical protein VIU61_23070 [Kofleriaceae bacterium]
MILAAVLAGGCSRADAEPPGIAVPKTWEKLPAIGEAVRDELTVNPKIEVIAADGWGERAMGCYAFRLDAKGPGSATAIADQILSGIAAASVDVSDVIKPPAGTGVLSLGFERAPYRGRLRAQIGPGTINAVACFANQREPKACELACDGLLGGIK